MASGEVGVMQNSLQPTSVAEPSNGPPSPSATEQQQDLRDEEEICRICRCGAEDDHPLFNPCVCAGSMKHVHEDCLTQWLTHANTAQQCELCGHKFSFTALYSPGAPDSLSPLELVALSVQHLVSYIPFLFRLIFVILCWGIQVPLFTALQFRVLSRHSFGRDESVLGWDSVWGFAEDLVGDGLTNWKTGVGVNACILVSFLALLSVVDFVRFHGEEEEEIPAWARQQEEVAQEEPNENLHEAMEDEHDGQEVVQETNSDENIVNSDVASASNGFEQDSATGTVQTENHHIHGSEKHRNQNLEFFRLDAIDPLPADFEDESEPTTPFDDGIGIDFDDLDGSSGDPTTPLKFNNDDVLRESSNYAENRSRTRTLASSTRGFDSENSDDDDTSQGIATGASAGVENEEVPIANTNDNDQEGPQAAERQPQQENEPIAAELEPGVAVPEDFINGEDGVDLNIAFDELVGLRGPMHVLVHHSMLLLTFDGLYLCMTVYMPTSVGVFVMRKVSGIMQRLFPAAFLYFSSGSVVASSNTFDWDGILGQNGGMVSESSNMCPAVTSLNSVVWVPQGHRLAKTSLEACQTSRHALLAPEQCTIVGTFNEMLYSVGSDVGAVILGYFVTFLAGFSCWVFFKVLRAKIVRPNQTSLPGETSMLLDYLIMCLDVNYKVAKVTFLLAMKMAVMPIMLGVLLERFTRELFAVSMDQRYLFAINHPVYSLMAYWVAGISHMLVITIVLLQLRDVLHPDILHSILRAHDGNVNLLRSLLLQPLGRHLRRMVLSGAIYTLLIIGLVYAPIRLAVSYLPEGYLPYQPKIRYVSVDMQLPAELVFFHIGLLHFLDHGKSAILKFLKLWLNPMCNVLGLTRYLLPCPDPDYDETSDTNNHRNNPRLNDGDDEPSPSVGLLPRESPNMLLPRLAVVAVAGWITAVLGVFGATVVPYGIGTLVLGETLFLNDFHAYAMGWSILWQVYTGLNALHSSGVFQHFARTGEHVQRLVSIRNQLYRQVPYILSLVIGFCVLIPFAIGISWDVILASRSVDECLLQSPIDFTPQVDLVGRMELVCPIPVGSVARCLWDISWLGCWKLGASVTLVATYMLVMDRFQPILIGGHVAQVITTSIAKIKNDQDFVDANRLVLLPLIRILYSPILFNLVTITLLEQAYSFQYSKSAIREFGFGLLQRVSIVVLGVLCALPRVVRTLQKGFSKLHDVLRDERYLVGRKLLNIGDQSRVV